MKFKKRMAFIVLLGATSSFGYQSKQSDQTVDGKECLVTGVKAISDFFFKLECAQQNPKRFIVNNRYMLPMTKPISDLLLYAKTHKLLVNVKALEYGVEFQIQEVELLSNPLL